MEGWVEGRDTQLAGVESGSRRLTPRQAMEIHTHTHTERERHHPSCRTGGNSSTVHCANASGKAATVADSLSGWVGDSSVGVRERERQSERLDVRLCNISLSHTRTQNAHDIHTNHSWH